MDGHPTALRSQINLVDPAQLTRRSGPERASHNPALGLTPFAGTETFAGLPAGLGATTPAVGVLVHLVTAGWRRSNRSRIRVVVEYSVVLRERTVAAGRLTALRKGG